MAREQGGAASERVRVVAPGAAELFLAGGVVPLDAAETVYTAMLAGWAAQQRSRGLNPETIKRRDQAVGRFMSFTAEYPWRWTPSDVEEWTSELVGRGVTHSTVRNYQASVSMFCAYIADVRYQWGEVCQERFGTHPVQVFHEWNTLVRRSEYEGRPGKRPLSRDELQSFFDHCDQRVADIAASGRKGWLAAYRDATLFKVAYAYGLRRREVAMLETVDWSANPAAEEFGSYGALSVRWGKAVRGGPPRRRTVVTTMGWAVDVVAEWIEEIRPMYESSSTAMWPTERGLRISNGSVSDRFASYRDALGLDPVLGPHCLRHSYASHLLEDGFDHLFVQQQLGHAWGSTTAIYTSVGTDYKNKALRRALSRVLDPGDGE